jgi:TolA-binding protein
LVYYEKALTIKPDFTVSIFNKAETLYNLGKKDESLVFYRQLIEKFPGDRYAKKAKDRLSEIGEAEGK